MILSAGLRVFSRYVVIRKTATAINIKDYKMQKIVNVRFIRKPCNIEEMTADLEQYDIRPVLSEVIEIWDMSADEYDIFAADFFAHHQRLNGKGGRTGNLHQVIEINAPERKTLYVNPEGFDYARYVGFETIVESA